MRTHDKRPFDRAEYSNVPAGGTALAVQRRLTVMGRTDLDRQAAIAKLVKFEVARCGANEHSAA